MNSLRFERQYRGSNFGVVLNCGMEIATQYPTGLYEITRYWNGNILSFMQFVLCGRNTHWFSNYIYFYYESSFECND